MKLSNWILAFVSFLAMANVARAGDSVEWSRLPPGGLRPQDIPQFVCITFDDNFGLADSRATGGVNFIVDFYKQKKNPPGAGNPNQFDGSPISAAFYYTSIYVVDDSKKVLGGKPGEDRHGRNRIAWTAAVESGHEAGVHTVNHFNGGVVPITDEDWGKARNWNADQWAMEIKSCKDTLTGRDGIGVKPQSVIGFRAPFLGYNDQMFTALNKLNFQYDTSLPNCFDDSEDGTNCSWPYRLDHGSPDMIPVTRKFSAPNATVPISFPEITNHPGLWEISPTTLVIPPDTMASKYGFAPGLRDRISKRGTLPYPSLYEGSTGKIAGLDYTLLMDAGLSGPEMSAVLKYNLDLHISGNRSPLVFIAHSHLYAFSSAEDNPDTPTAADRDARWRGLTDFINYALANPSVRIVSPDKMLLWIQKAALANGSRASQQGKN